MAAELVRRRFTVAEYEHLAKVGILHEDDRVELIEGEIVVMSPIGDRHVGGLNMLADGLADTARQDAIVSVQNPIRLSDDSAPQPDIALLRRDTYTARRVPTPDDVLLVIEVAESSRDYDRNVKLPLYAAAGIPEAWIVDLVAEGLERHSDPRDGIYTLTARARRGESLTSTVLPNLTLVVDDVLG